MHARRSRDDARQQRRRRALAGLLVPLAFACATSRTPSEPIPTAAIARRGGPLESFTRRSELLVHYGFPGRWRWEISFRSPDSFRLVLDTTGELQTFASDGTTSRTWLGNALVTEEPSRGSCSATLARWLAFASLDALTRPGVVWARVDPEPGGAHRILRARCREQGVAEFLLHFDRDLRLVRLSGPVSIPALGAGRLTARFHDFRRANHTLPFAIDYTLDGEPLAEERILEIVPNDPALGPDAFRRPAESR